MLDRDVCDWIPHLLANKATIVSATVLVTYLLSRIGFYQRGLKVVGRQPGLRAPFHPYTLIGGVLLPTSRWNPGSYFTWLDRFKLYRQFGTDTISVVPFLHGQASFWSSNLEVIRQVASNGPNSSFIKPEIGGSALLMWGMNLVSANGETWRKHRRILGPAFNNKLYEHVFDESVTLYRDMVESQGWAEKREVEIPVFQEHTVKFALLMVEICGFGIPFKWSAPPDAKDGSMTLQEVIHVVNRSFLRAAFVPWTLRLPFAKFRRMRKAYEELMNFMKSQVAERKAMVQKSSFEMGKDVFTMLVQANEDESAKYKLDDQELIGNVYAMLFAGHDTTATSLSATIGLLAFHQNIQNEIVEQIESVVGCDRDPTFADFAKLNKVLAALLESTRMFPAVYLMIREAAEDTILKIPKPKGQEGYTMVPIPKGTRVTGDMIGLQYNPRYFEEPEKFKPSRWYGIENDSEAFTGFSIGPRTCIGRKFATSEGVAFLTMLLRDWHIEPLLQSGEDKEEWSKRALDAEFLLLLGIKSIPVRMKKRRRP